MNNNQNKNNRYNQNNQNNQNNRNSRNSNTNSNIGKNQNYNNYNRASNQSAPNNYNYNNNNAHPPARRQQIRYTVPYQYQPHKRKPFIIKYGFRILMFLIFFAFISLVFISVFFLNLTWTKSNPEIIYTVNTTRIKNDKPEPVSSYITLSYDVGFANEQYYFPVNDIMEKMDFVLIGDKNEFSFVRSKSDEYIKFITDSNTVYINDEEYHLSGTLFTDDDTNLYAPVEFLDNVFENLVFSFDEKDKNKITVDVGDITESCFKIQKMQKLAAAKESDAPYFSGNPITFISDLSEYEQYFNPPADKIDEYIILINQTHLLDETYLPPDLTDLVDTRKDRATQQVRLYPAKALEAFLIEARANGFNNVTVTSAYRSYAYQTQLFNNEVAAMRPVHGDKAEEAAAVSVAYPGQSEHQSGLCLDMHNLAAAGQNFGETPDGKWLAENAHHFGFIVRYPEDKTEITGIKYEPWHFRYVGRYHATKMYELGLCLEEYWEQYLKK